MSVTQLKGSPKWNFNTVGQDMITQRRVSPNSESKSDSSLSCGFMSHGFIGKEVADGQFLVADGPFFPVGLF